MAHNLDHLKAEFANCKTEIAEVKTALDAFEADIAANGFDADESALDAAVSGKKAYRDIKLLVSAFSSQKAIENAGNKVVPT
jgi:hypothetical protein